MKINDIDYCTDKNRCTAQTAGITNKYRQRRGKSTKCGNFATYVVDGHPRCVIHAKNDAFNYVRDIGKNHMRGIMIGG